MTVRIDYEYFDHFNKDEEIYRRANNLTELGKHFKKKSGTNGSKDSSSATEKKL